jgi:hypothetical protein
MAHIAGKFEAKAAEQTKTAPKPKPTVKQEKGGWKHSGNTGGGHTGHDGKFEKKPDGPRRVIYDEGTLPPKKSISDLP